MRYRVHIVKLLELNDMDFDFEPANEIEIIDYLQDWKDSSNDGWRLIPCRKGLVDTEADIENYSLPVGASLELHAEGQASSTPADIATAYAAIQALDSELRFTLIQELSGTSSIIYERATLTVSDELGGYHHKYGRPNGHGRSGDTIY